MSQFNKKQPSQNAPNTINRAGGQAHAQSNELALASMLVTSFFAGGDYFYEKDADRKQRFIEALRSVSPLFAAKAAIYSRDRFGMRTSSHLAAKELATYSSALFPKERFFGNVIQRVDDMLEIAAAILSDEGGKLPAAVKRAFADKLQKFDLYQLSKYRSEGKQVNIYDLINLVHPKETPAIKSIIRGEFSAPETFETKLTQAGQNVEEGLSEEDKQIAVAANKKQAWRDLVLTGKIGYMALLKNLRNISQQADDETIDAACVMLSQENLIRKSRVLPFRFVIAMEELQKAGVPNKVVTAASKALDISVKNIPVLQGRTLVVVDNSGSMSGNISRHKNAYPMPAEKIAKVFAAAILKQNPNAELMLFSDNAGYLSVNTSDSVATIANKMRFRSGGTNFNAIFQAANKAYDRIFILSDMQGWIGYYTPAAAFNEYKNRTSANPMIYSIDLVGYGDMQFPESKVVTIAGFSDRILEFVELYENGLGGIVEEINKVEL